MDASQASQEMVMLNINQRVTALAAGNLNPEKSNNDILLIGTPTNLLGFLEYINCFDKATDNTKFIVLAASVLH